MTLAVTSPIVSVDRNDDNFRHRAGLRVDLWLAMLAGPLPWVDPDRRATGAEAATVATQVVAVASVVTWSGLDLGRRHSPSIFIWIGLAFIAAAIVVPNVAWASRGARPPEALWGRPRLAAVVRGVLVLGGLVLWALRTPGSPILGAWPFGVAAGSEVALTLWAVGMAARPFAWWRRFLVSAPQIGALGALVAVGAVSHNWPTVIALFVTMHLVAGLTALTLAVLQGMRVRFRTEVATRERAVSDAAARQRAHWLHDEVCTRLGFVQQKVAAGGIRPEAVVDELRALDHTLRERQLEELLVAGTVELAEVVQPYLRMAQQQGVRLVAVPSYEDTQVTLDAQTGHLVKRALANLVGNALKAGATQLGVSARVRSDEPNSPVEIVVTDNGGGFDFSHLAAGRGLFRLAEELGRDNLVFERTSDGMRILAIISSQEIRQLS